jgi:hypothetical protein
MTLAIKEMLEKFAGEAGNKSRKGCTESRSDRTASSRDWKAVSEQVMQDR